MNKKELVTGFLDVFTRTLSEALCEVGPEEIQVNWNLASDGNSDSETWTWWSGGLAAHPGAIIFLGAPEETWEKLGRSGDSEDSREKAFAMVGRCFQKAVTQRFGDDAATQDCGPASVPEENGTRVSIQIGFPAGHWPNAGCVLNPGFEEALGSLEEITPSTVSATTPYSPPASSGRLNQSDMLMHVQVPVSVSFGGTQIRMKDLLNLSTGSVVELDQGLHDNVEVRINDRLIARGEVVAVDGYYGVRVLELVSAESGASSGKGSRP
jgi:flagellar motor switch protein FliN